MVEVEGDHRGRAYPLRKSKEPARRRRYERQQRRSKSSGLKTRATLMQGKGIGARPAGMSSTLLITFITHSRIACRAFRYKWRGMWIALRRLGTLDRLGMNKGWWAIVAPASSRRFAAQ